MTYVSGTPQAREALLENSVPTTTAVKRNDTSVEVEYDGEPQFEDVATAPLRYAVNTASSVFEVAGIYYVCDQGIWYDAFSATGPWQVATKVPDEIYQIPASNPHYNVTYVHVYDVTPSVVYVGYTPGYYGSYYYHGSIVYGTGWYYPPWYGYHYYPRPVTYGFRVAYNPYSGWGFGMSWSNGPFRFSVSTGGSYYGGRWGMGGYRPYPRPYVGPSYRKTNANINNIPGRGNGNISSPATRNNLYNRETNINRNVAQRPSINQQPARVANDRSNNVFSDKSGNIYQRNNTSGNWQQRSQGKWSSPSQLDRQAPNPSTRNFNTANRPNNRPSSGNSATRPGLERDYAARQQGNQRANQFQTQQMNNRGGRPQQGRPTRR